MVQYAEAARAGAGKMKGNKRLRSEMTPVPDNEVGGGSERPASRSNAPRKKTKDEAEGAEIPVNSGASSRKPASARGKGRAAAPVSRGKMTRARGASVAARSAIDEEEEEEMKPRRSARGGGQKAARK